ncbi:MAG: tRNA (N(6)-L-threonylcarbamoyladenosine(37)-C(2))-methylthiotransferase MtaB [Clostridia bacterium]|nr:tRNA (N(6)-L-threonylcarbamoyladenosine(37)-C(2))-methylthiotransferase MtaB [Clostridia bacterium]
MKDKKVSVLTLGCRVNQYESDSFTSRLKEAGVTIVPFGEAADLAVVNTCTVTAESDRKSRQMIRRAAQNAGMVLVAGCFSQIDPESAASMEKVVYVCGNNAKSSLADTILSLLDGSYTGKVNAVAPPCEHSAVEMTVPHPMRTRSYIKIEDGCENRCSYCIISTARGPVRSKDPALVLDEIRTLAAQGCREIILTGIETAAYGMDFDNRRPYGHALADLITQAAAVEGIERIGLGSLDPTVMSEYFCDTVKKVPALLPHFHLSIQSGSSRILAKMRRKYNRDMALAAAARMRKAIPEATFSADIIVGFPGETEDDFADTLDFCRQVQFLHLHIFPYSKRTGTEAALMPDQIPEPVKKQRLATLEAEGRRIRKNLLMRYVEDHRETPVYLLVEKCIDGLSSGHSEHFAEIKKVPYRAEIGQVIPVRLTETDGDICIGVIG